ncbi:hypothetical protein AGMMS50249_3920 [candidate division SR1 bacterium]|nr:hypothetical protein AGMMS50249_3920 [candidate division SR1 bacterium]
MQGAGVDLPSLHTARYAYFGDERKEQYMYGMLQYLHNAHFRETHLKDKNKLENLCVHLLGNREIKLNPILGKVSKQIFELIFSPKFTPMGDEEKEALQKSILDIYNGKSTLIISNHDTFANLPMIIHKYLQLAKEMGISNFNQNIYTILGPLLTMHKTQKKIITAQGNTLVTIPAGTEQPALKSVYSRERAISGEKMRSLLRDPNDQGRGAILLCCPSGTRDVIYRRPDGKPVIFLPDDYQSSNRVTFQTLVAPFRSNDHVNMLMIGSNTTAMKENKPANNNQWNRGSEIELHVCDLKEKQMNTTKDMINLLTDQVQFHGESIAIALPKDVFDILKKKSKKREICEEDLSELNIDVG